MNMNQQSNMANRLARRARALVLAIAMTTLALPMSASALSLDLSAVFDLKGAVAPNERDARSNLFSDPAVDNESSAKRAAVVARREVGGRIISVKPSRNGHKVRLLVQGGRVVTVMVDKEGRLISSD